MTVLAVTSSRTSPGATSLATGLALALSTEHERSLLVEADPAGGVLSLRFDLDVTPSLTTFGSDTRNGYDHELVWRNTQDLRGARCLPAPVDPRLARSWVERVTPDLVQHLPSIGAPVVIDLGWISEDGPSLGLAEAADVTLVVTRPEMAEVQALLFQVRQLQNSGATVGLVTVGTAPNDPQEVASVAGVPLVAVLPDDAALAAALRGAKFAPNKFRRSLLWRTIGGIADSLVNADLMRHRADASTLIGSSAAGDTSSAAPVAGPAGPPPIYRPEPETTPIPATAPSAGPAPTTAAIAEPITVSAAGESTPVPVATVFGESIPVGEFPDPPRPSFSDRHGGDLSGTADRSRPVADTGAATSLGSIGATPSPDPSRPTRISVPSVDVDLTVDPELIDVTNKLATLPEAELIMDTGERVRLDSNEPTLIGRHSDCEIMIRDSQVSRRHGRLTRTATGWHYCDLGSRNGSVINGRPCTESFLEAGDELYIGGARFIFQTVPTHPNHPIHPNRPTSTAASVSLNGAGGVATLDKETA